MISRRFFLLHGSRLIISSAFDAVATQAGVIDAEKMKGLELCLIYSATS